MNLLHTVLSARFLVKEQSLVILNSMVVQSSKEEEKVADKKDQHGDGVHRSSSSVATTITFSSSADGHGRKV